MKRTKRPPDWRPPMGADQALDKLSPLLRVIYALLEEGVEEANAWFATRKKPVHNVVFAVLVRLKVWENIVERAAAAGISCRVVFRANVGVRIIYNGSVIAVWKADKDGKLPACGESEQRQHFYTQPALPNVYGSDALPQKLAVLWERGGHTSLNVKLVAPKGFDSMWKAGLIHWEIDVPHPAQTIAAQTDHLASGAEELDDILKHKKTADEPNGKG